MKGIIAALCTTSAMALAAPVSAQVAETNTNAEAGDEAIIVTARRREESAQDVPLVVNTVTSEQIRKLNLQNFTEVPAIVPGLQLNINPSGIGSAAQIRGVQYDGNSSAPRSVEFYVNDAVIPGDVIFQQMYDVGQIEVLRGPQGTLRGRASPSGSITLTTRKPDLDRVGGYVSANGNTIGGVDLHGAVGVPVIEGIAAVRVAGSYSEGEVNRVRTINGGADDRRPFSRSEAGRVSLLLKPVEWLRIDGVYDRLERKAAFYNQYASASLFYPVAASPVLIRPKDRLSIAEIRDTSSQTFDTYNWRAEASLAGQALIYQGQRAIGSYLATGTSDPANRFAGTDFPGSTRTRSKGTSHELRLQNVERVLGMFDYVIGAYRSTFGAKTRLVSVTPIALPPFAGGGLVATSNTNIIPGTPSLKETSFFGNVTAHIGEKTQISGGLRHIRSEQPASSLTLDFGNGAPTVLPTSTGLDDRKLIYSAAIQHSFTPDLMVYANTGTSRRPGPTIVGIFSPVQSTRQRQFTVMPSEDSTSYEIGMKSSWMDGRLIFNIAAFHQKFKNYTYKMTSDIYYTNYNFDFTTFQFVPAVGSSSQWAAPVPVTVKGVEADLTFRPSESFSVQVVAAYADGQIKNGIIPCNDLDGDGKADTLSAPPTVGQLQSAYGANNIGSCSVNQRSAYQSPFSASILSEYNRPLSEHVTAFARGQFSYNGSSKNDPANAYDNVGAYGLLNLFAGIRDPEGNWEVNFYAKNVLNKVEVLKNSLAVTSFQELTFGNPPTVGRSFTSPYARIETTAPRQFGLNVRFAFGSR